MDENEYEALKIGALLHDIGKWYKLLDNDSSENNGSNNGHVDYGVKFIGGKINFKEYWGSNNSEIEKIKTIKFLIENHHGENNENKLLNILKISDKLSNGELITYNKNASSNDDLNLASIFENISISENENNKKTSNKNYIYPLMPLNVSEKSFPKINIDNNTKKVDDEDFKKINNFEDLLLFIQKYTWCVPSTYNMEKKDSNYFSDVSLYDHLKTTCAIACCLYNNKDKLDVKNLLDNLDDEANKIKEIINNYEVKEKNKKEDNEILLKEKLDEIKYINEHKFSLIHGDISGVQDFIFNITSKGANKSLKGRSFYLDFLTELCARYVVNELNLPIANILFYGGGHFYILSHNIEDKKVNDFEEKINDILFDKFGANLYVAIGKVNLRPIDFLIDCMDEDAKIGIPYKWKEAADETSKKKMKKFEYKGMKLFEAKGSGDENKRCKICKSENAKITNEKCEYCESFEELTTILRDFGIEKKFSVEQIKDLKVLTDFFKNKMVEFENNIYELPDNEGNLKIPYKLGSIAFPMDNNKIKEFSELGEDAEKRTGTNKLAILKMDVDNLGKIITKGLNKPTISRLSTLSSMLTLFFTGYIPYLIKTGKAETVFEEEGNVVKKVEYKNNVYLTYSGGDDTLIVGAWDVVWDLAKEINDKFKEFVCNNPDITLSAGVVLVSPKFEYRKGVYLAEEELENAKENIMEVNGKSWKKIQ